MVVKLFGELNDSLGELTSDQRSALTRLLKDRIEYQRRSIALNEMRLMAIADPSPETEKRMRDYAEEFITPLQASITKQEFTLIRDTIDVDGLKEMLPMALMSLAQYVNVPLLLTAMGVEPDKIGSAVELLRDFFKDGFS